MAVRQIRTDNDEILRKKSNVVTEITSRILMILDDMAETMYVCNGLGLAAPQIGILRRMAVIDIGDGLIELINPQIIDCVGEEVDVEGCLSVPGYQGSVVRPEKVTVRYQNRLGEELTLTAEGLLKKALCHEIDHLDGILYIDKAIDLYKLFDEDEFYDDFEDEV